MLLGIAVHINLSNALYREFLMLECDVVGTRREFGSVLLDVLGERSREENVLGVLCG